MNMNETTNKQRVFRIRDYRMPDAQAKLEKLNARGARLGCAPAVLTVVGHEDEPVFSTIVEPRRQIGVNRYVLVTVDGTAPKFAGWQLGACIENTDGGNILRKSPDCKVELDARFRTCASGCEHCNADRNRKETFVVIHEDGAQKLVGRDCIRDFLGHTSPDNILSRAEWAFSLSGAFDEFESEGSGGWSSTSLTSVETLLAYSSCATRVYGFISGSRARASQECGGNVESTGGTATRWMLPPPRNMSDKERAERQTPSDLDIARGVAAREYVLATLGARTDLSDFENNMLVACRAENIDRKNIGLVAFVVEYHARETEKSLARERAAIATHYPVAEKTRVRGVAVRYVRSIGYESQFGAGYFHLFTTVEGGHALKWSTGSSLDCNPGAEFDATFTVKSHDVFNGAKQTSISRAVLTERAVSAPVIPIATALQTA